jgi:hypothetical protein
MREELCKDRKDDMKEGRTTCRTDDTKEERKE